MILRQFEEAVWHRWGSDCDEAKPWNQDGEIVSPVEAVFEFGEVARHVLAVDGAVGSCDGGLDALMLPRAVLTHLNAGVRAAFGLTRS